MRFNRQILLAFLIPLILAGISLYLLDLTWRIGREECKEGIDFFGDLSCANTNTQTTYAFLYDSIYALVFTSIFLPLFLLFLSRPITQPKIFD
jgi:hypothetical protein